MEQVNAIELIVNEFLQGLGGWLRLPMTVITNLGSEEFFILLLTWLYWSMDQMAGLRVGMVLLLGNTLNTVFKFLFHNPRPYWLSDRVQPYSTESTSFSLPSGHSQIAASVWGWLAMEVKKRWFTILALVLIFLIGLSRIYLGVHFLSDVLLGWALGGLLVWAFSVLRRPVSRWLAAKSLGFKLGLVLASAAVMVGLILGARAIGFPRWTLPPKMVVWSEGIDPFNLDGAFTLSGTWTGMLAGYLLLAEGKGRFLAGEGGWRRLVRFLVGLVGVALLWFGLGEVFPREADVFSYALRFLRYTLTGLWVAWWGPLVFEKLGLLRFAEDLSPPSPRN
jgi:membrane-associated phospholipid phosphatase